MVLLTVTSVVKLGAILKTVWNFWQKIGIFGNSFSLNIPSCDVDEGSVLMLTCAKHIKRT
jgi:hypothetical protein